MMRRYSSFGALARALERAADRMQLVMGVTAEKGALMVQSIARQKIGHYQEAVGPFPEWAPLAESTEAEKARLGFSTGAPLLRTGDLRKSIEAHSSPLGFRVGSKLDIAAYQEFGTEHIPPRPFLGPALLESTPEVLKMVGKNIEANLAGKEME